MYMCVESPKGDMKILIPNQVIKLRVNAQTIEHYRSKDYICEMNKPIYAKAEDLTHFSDKEILVICDYCGKEFKKQYKKYISQRKHIKKDACYDCFSLKEKEMCNFKYGVDCVLQLPEIKLKSQNTLNEKFGVENCMQNPETLNKFKNTMMERHGCEFAQQSEIIREKSRQTLINNFGVEHPIYNKDIKDKVNDFLYVNGRKVSNGQMKIAQLFNGSINTNINGYFADVVLLEDNIIIEYNGSGHRLAVLFNKVSEEEFHEKELHKIITHISTGWKCLTIENPTEKYLNKNRLLDITNLINNIKNNNIIDSTTYTIL